jgi:hypothetical protein
MAISHDGFFFCGPLAATMPIITLVHDVDHRGNIHHVESSVQLLAQDFVAKPFTPVKHR